MSSLLREPYHSPSSTSVAAVIREQATRRDLVQRAEEAGGYGNASLHDRSFPSMRNSIVCLLICEIHDLETVTSERTPCPMRGNRPRVGTGFRFGAETAARHDLSEAQLVRSSHGLIVPSLCHWGYHKLWHSARMTDSRCWLHRLMLTIGFVVARLRLAQLRRRARV